MFSTTVCCPYRGSIPISHQHVLLLALHPRSSPQIDWKQWADMDSNQVTHELSGRKQIEVEAYRVVTTSVDDYLRGEPRPRPWFCS